MGKRRILLCFGAVLLAAAAWAAWTGLDLPPPGAVLRHGFSPTKGLTGRTMGFEGIEFLEMAAGYHRAGSHQWCEEGNLLGRIGAVFGAQWGVGPKHGGAGCPEHWVEIPEPLWVGRFEVTNAQYERFDPDRRRVPQHATDDQSVVGVTYERAAAYCRWLTERGDGWVFRLPTESEWEYASHAYVPRAEEMSGLLPFNEFVPSPTERDRPGLARFDGGVLEWCAGPAGGVVRDRSWFDISEETWRWKRLRRPVEVAVQIYETGFRVVATRGGPLPGKPPEVRLPPDRWLPVWEGERAEIHAERALYEKDGEEHFLVHFVVTNRTDRRIGVDLRDYWSVPAPSQWGGLPGPRRWIINQSIFDAPAFGPPEREALRVDFRAGKLVTIPPRGEISYFREFNSKSPRTVAAQMDPCLYVSLAGTLRVTDGVEVERVGESLTWIDMILITPIYWRTVPEGARIVEDR